MCEQEEAERQERIKQTEDLRRGIQMHLNELKRRRLEEAEAQRLRVSGVGLTTSCDLLLQWTPKGS